MKKIIKNTIHIMKRIIVELFTVIAFAIFVCGLVCGITKKAERVSATVSNEAVADNYIKWMEFTPTKEALELAYQWDVDTYTKEHHIDWIALLAYGAVRGGGKYNKSVLTKMNCYAEDIMEDKENLEELSNMDYYAYYYETLSAVLGGMVGNYKIQVKNKSGELVWQDCYGLKAFSPIAKGYYYEDYDDFGTGRSYGYKRKHLGHDMMGQIGTPIIAVESGYVEALGWNQYGGWRIGIRSMDKKRYYYYAHLRQDTPYASELKQGDYVTAGQVIGYMGHTGYSVKENVNNIETIHLHFGIEIIFDECQKDSDNEIWVDCFELTKFLSKNRSSIVRLDEDSKEWKREFQMQDPIMQMYVPDVLQGQKI